MLSERSLFPWNEWAFTRYAFPAVARRDDEALARQRMLDETGPPAGGMPPSQTPAPHRRDRAAAGRADGQAARALRRRRHRQHLLPERRGARPRPRGEGALAGEARRARAAPIATARWDARRSRSSPSSIASSSARSTMPFPRWCSVSPRARRSPTAPGILCRGADGANPRGPALAAAHGPRRAPRARLRRLCRGAEAFRPARRGRAMPAARILPRLLVGRQAPLHLLRAERQRHGLPAEGPGALPARGAGDRAALRRPLAVHGGQHPFGEVLPRLRAVGEAAAAQPRLLLRDQGQRHPAPGGGPRGGRHHDGPAGDRELQLRDAQADAQGRARHPERRVPEILRRARPHRRLQPARRLPGRGSLRVRAHGAANCPSSSTCGRRTA